MRVSLNAILIAVLLCLFSASVLVEPAKAVPPASEGRPNVLAITQGARVVETSREVAGREELLFDGHPKTGMKSTDGRTPGKPLPKPVEARWVKLIVTAN